MTNSHATPKNIFTKKRHRDLIELLIKENLNNQEVICRMLSKMGHKVSQSTVSRDIKELNIKKDKNGYYKVDDAIKQKNLENILSDFMKSSCAKLHSPTYALTISVTPGYEKLLSMKVKAAFSNVIIGTIIGDGIILVITDNEKNLKFLSDKLKKLSP